MQMKKDVGKIVKLENFILDCFMLEDFMLESFMLEEVSRFLFIH